MLATPAQKAKNRLIFLTISTSQQQNLKFWQNMGS